MSERKNKSNILQKKTKKMMFSRNQTLKMKQNNVISDLNMQKPVVKIKTILF